MKKLFVMIAILSFTVAQDSGMSLYGGLNLANFDCSDCETDVLPSFVLGVQKNMGSFVLGAGISGRGAKFEESGMTRTDNFMYLDLHVLKPFPVGPGALFAGVDLGMNLSAKTNIEGCPSGLEDFCGESDIEDVAMDYGIMLGYSYPVNEKMSVYASYYHGLAEISKDWETTHTGIGLGLGYGL